MSAGLHNKDNQKVQVENREKENETTTMPSDSQREDRLAAVIALHSKEMSQSEIAGS
jgi:hypothetical protein